MKTIFLTVLLAAIGAQAKSKVIEAITDETTVSNLSHMGFKCRPGVAPNGHNFATTSSFTLNVSEEITATLGEIKMYDSSAFFVKMMPMSACQK